MSRKWERQVERNAKKVNAQRKRFGQQPMYEQSKGSVGSDERIKGRSIIMPFILACAGVFYMTMFWNARDEFIYWVTVISYLVLSVIVFLFRRPFLDIGKQTLMTRKFAGFRTVKPEDIEQIESQPGYIIVKLKGKGSRWVFSRSMNRFDTDYMEKRLKEFAVKHNVQFGKMY